MVVWDVGLDESSSSSSNNGSPNPQAFLRCRAGVRKRLKIVADHPFPMVRWFVTLRQGGLC